MIQQIQQIVTIDLNVSEAELFKRFMQYHEKIAMILGSGALDTRNGSIDIHFDQDSRIKEIKRHEILAKC